MIDPSSAHLVVQHCSFETARLAVGPWHTVASDAGVDLGQTVSQLLTPATTLGLPQEWRGVYSVARARTWIDERDAESITLLVVERHRHQPVGLVILFVSPVDETLVDLRIGYLVAESAWGQGYATELVAGLVAWARSQPAVATLIAGVDASNEASIRVLAKCGFAPVSDSDEPEAFFELATHSG